MCIDPSSLVTLGGTALGLIKTSRNRRRAREFARRQGELDNRQLDNRQSLLLEQFAQAEIESTIRGLQTRSTIQTSGSERGLSNRTVSRVQTVNQNTIDRQLENQRATLELSLEGLDIQRDQSDLSLDQALTGNAPLDALDIGSAVLTQPNLNAVRTAFGLR